MNDKLSKENILKELRQSIKAIESSHHHASITHNENNPSEISFTQIPSHVRSSDTLEDSLFSNKTDNPAYQKLLHLISYKEYSSYGMKKRLSQYDFSFEDIEDAIQSALDISLIDDDRYARSFVRMNIAKGKGFKGIRKELSQQHIDLDDIKGWRDEFSFSERNEKKRAYLLLNSKHFAPKKCFNKAYNALYRKGYETSIAYEVARQWCIDHQCYLSS